MHALVWDGPGQLHVGEMPDPRPGPGEVVVRTGAAGVCGSEVEGYLGRQPNRTPPLVMGHELAGEVVALGDGVEGSWQGRTVAVNPIVSCRRCRYCRRGARNLCRHKGLIGIARPGGFAELVATPAANLVGLPDGFDARLGAFVEPMANGVHAARLGSDGIAVQRAAVIGAGAIGLCALQSLRMLGVEAVHLVEPDERRRSTAERLGADPVHASGDTLRASLGIGDDDRSGGDGAGVDVVIDAVGASATRQLAVEVVRPHGTVVLIGLHDDDTTLAFRPVVRDELRLVGSYAYNDDDFAAAAEWTVAGDVGPGDIEPTHPLAEGPDVFAGHAAGKIRAVRSFLGHG